MTGYDLITHIQSNQDMTYQLIQTSNSDMAYQHIHILWKEDHNTTWRSFVTWSCFELLRAISKICLWVSNSYHLIESQMTIGGGRKESWSLLRWERRKIPAFPLVKVVSAACKLTAQPGTSGEELDMVCLNKWLLVDHRCIKVDTRSALRERNFMWSFLRSEQKWNQRAPRGNDI